MSHVCPANKDHGEFGSKENLAAHLSSLHPELLSGAIAPIPTIKSPDSGVVVTKTTQDLDKIIVNKPPVFTPENLPSKDELVATGKKSASTEELMQRLEVTSKVVEKPTEKRTPKKVQLTYKYIGECPACLSEATTLMLKIKGELHAVAFCKNCNEQIDEMTVIDLYLSRPLEGPKHGSKRT